MTEKYSAQGRCWRALSAACRPFIPPGKPMSVNSRELLSRMPSVELLMPPLSMREITQALDKGPSAMTFDEADDIQEPRLSLA